MLFVDGENLTLRSQELAAKHGQDLASLANVYEKDVCFWPKSWLPRLHPFASNFDARMKAERAYYYTSVRGDQPKIDAIEDKLHDFGFHPRVFHKKGGDKAKGVDITLTTDMLVHGFRGHYEIAVLVSGDGDYVPVVEELQRMGRIVVVSFFQQEGCGLNPKLRLASDDFCPFDLLVAEGKFQLTHYVPNSPLEDPGIPTL